jgi:InsA N-terminal domain
MTFIAVRCPHCQSDQIIKRGKTARGTQRYLCQNTRWVAYLLAADIVSRLPSCRLSDDNQPVIMTRNRFSPPRSSLLACLGAHASRSIPRSSTGMLF